MKMQVLCICVALGIIGCAIGRGDRIVPVDAEATPILKGRVTDEADNPIPGADVTLYAGIATRWREAGTQTDANGEYVFDPCRHGSLVLDERHRRWDYFIGMTVSAPGYASKEGESMRDVRVPQVDGQVTTEDFVLVPSN